MCKHSSGVRFRLHRDNSHLVTPRAQSGQCVMDAWIWRVLQDSNRFVSFPIGDDRTFDECGVLNRKQHLEYTIQRRTYRKMSRNIDTRASHVIQGMGETTKD